MDIDDDEGIEVPENEYSLSEEYLEELEQLIDPLSDDGNYGIEHYCKVLDFCGIHLFD